MKKNNLVTNSIAAFLVFSQRIFDEPAKASSVASSALQCCLENNLHTKAEKRLFELPQMSVLGYIVSKEGFCMDPEKFAAVSNSSGLKAVSKLLLAGDQQLLCCCCLIIILTQKKTDLKHWTSDAVEALHTFCSGPAVVRPDTTVPSVASLPTATLLKSPGLISALYGYGLSKIKFVLQALIMLQGSFVSKHYNDKLHVHNYFRYIGAQFTNICVLVILGALLAL